MTNAFSHLTDSDLNTLWDQVNWEKNRLYPEVFRLPIDTAATSDVGKQYDALLETRWELSEELCRRATRRVNPLQLARCHQTLQ